MKVLKLLNRGIFKLVFFMIPVFTVSVTMTSCDKLLELIEGDEEDDEEYIDEMRQTVDGKEPYFKLLTEEVKIPQYMRDDYDRLVVDYETNLAQFCSFVIDSYMKQREVEYTETIPYFIFKNMEYYASDLNRAEFDFYPNSRTTEVRDTILVINPFNSEEVMAKIPVVQEAGEYVKVVDCKSDKESLILSLEGSENATAYGICVSQYDIPLDELQYEVHDNDYARFDRRDEYTLKDGKSTCKLEGLYSDTEYYIYIAAMDKYGKFTGITEFKAKTTLTE